MEILRLAPERLTKLALMDTNPLAETPQVAADREPQIIKAKKGQMLEVIRDEMKPSYFAPGGKRKEVLNVVMDMALKLGPDVFIRQSRALQKRLDQQATLRGAKLNTLVLCGEFDSLCPPKRHQLMTELIPDARLKVIENAGHLPTLEQPFETTEVMQEWLSQPWYVKYSILSVENASGSEHVQPTSAKNMIE